MESKNDFSFEDLVDVFDSMEKIHPNLFFHITKSKFEKELYKSKENWDNLDIYEKNYELMRLSALIGDFHTSVMPTIQSNYTYPYRVSKCKEGYFITNCAQKSFADKNMYAQILAINGLEIDELKEIVGKIICEEVGVFEKKFCYILSCPLYLKIAKVVDSNAVELTLKKDGQVYKVEVSPALEKVGNKVMIWLYTKKKANFEFVDNGKYFYIDINKFYRDKNMNLNKLYCQAMKAIDAREPFIVDVRGNTGGHYDLFKKIVEQINVEEIKGYCLIDRKTCSAAVMTAKALKNAGFILVGEPTSQPSTFYGGIINLETKSGMNFDVATSLVDDNQQRHTKFIPRSVKFDDKPLQPDIYIEPSIQDHRSGNDPALEYCKKNISKFAETNRDADYF